MTAGRVAVVVFVLTACGGLSGSREGSSGSDDAEGGVGASGGSAGSDTSGAGGSNAAGSGNGGGAARGGTAGACASEECLTFFTMSDFETAAGWPPALGVAGAFGDQMPYIVSLDPPRDASRFALHLDEPEELGGADLAFHQHFPLWIPHANGLGEPYVGVRFWAKRGEVGPASIVVALTGLDEERSDYVGALEAGYSWLVRRFELTRDWQRYFALFSDFGHEGDGTPVPAADLSGQVVHFIVPSGEPLDLWVDDIELACAPGTC